MDKLCQRCSIKYDEVYYVSNELWLRTTGQRGGMFCLPCLDRLAREEGIDLYWKAEEQKTPFGEREMHKSVIEGASRMNQIRSTSPKIFTMIRAEDESGVSGIGRVLGGVLFHTGQVVVCWRTDTEAAAHGHSSLGIYPSWKAFEFIHIESHPANKAQVIWLDDLLVTESL